MNITDFQFSILHGVDGQAQLSLHHGGDVYQMDLDNAQRQSLGLNLLDATHADPVSDDETGEA